MKLDAATFQLSDSINVGGNGNLEGEVTYPTLEWSSSSERESSSDDGDGFGSSLASSLEEHDWVSKSWMEVTRNPSIPADKNVEARVPISSAIRSGKTTTTETAKCENLFINSGIGEDVEYSGNQLDSARGSSNEIFFLQEIGNSVHHHNKNMATALEDSTISASSNKAFFLQQNMDAISFYSEDFCMASPKCSGTDVIDAEEASIKALAKPFNSMNRIPKVENGSLRTQIKLAGLLVEEKTKLRDAIQIQANSQVHGLDYEYAKGESKSAQNLVNSKRMEIDHLLSVINKAKNALAIEDVDIQINTMEHMIHYEMLSLKEEKHLMHKKRQLKLLREQLTWNLGNEDEIKSALEQREEAEKKLRILKKELNILKNTVLKAEATALQAGKKYRYENIKLRELQLQLVAANDDRRMAYSQCQNLSEEFWTKNTLSLEYKNDTVVARNCVLGSNGKAPHHLYTNQNMNNMFRQEYIKIKELGGSVDGGAFGHKKERSILANYVLERVDRMVSDTANVNYCLSQIPTLELKHKAAIKNVNSNDKLMEEVIQRDNQEESHKGFYEPSVRSCGLLMVSCRDGTSYFEELDNLEEQAELTTNTEIVSTEEDEFEAKLKGQQQLEELTKANEARERKRKKRQENKIQMRKELKARKEAEQKEKEREKRLRKKVRKMATGINADDTNCSGPSPKDTSPVAQKRQQAQFLKQSKAKSAPVPPSLCNRNKKLYRQWMGLGLSTLFISIVFCCVNIEVFSCIQPKAL